MTVDSDSLYKALSCDTNAHQ